MRRRDIEIKLIDDAERMVKEALWGRFGANSQRVKIYVNAEWDAQPINMPDHYASLHITMKLPAHVVRRTSEFYYKRKHPMT